MIRIFIGYDPREAAAYHVLSHSIHARASQPVSITPLMLSQLGGIYSRERNPLQSTDFSFSRFLVPSLCNFQGWAIFLDCDMLLREDIAQLWNMRDERFAVQVVKHQHTPREETKFLGAPQTGYQKKNWSSVMLLNCARCQTLTADYVNTASGLQLHQFQWLSGLGREPEQWIGEIPKRWNHLVGYDQPDPTVANVHFTLGGPYFDEFRDCEYAEAWFAERADMLNVAQRAG